MEIPVLGMDPSMTNWGLAEGMLDLKTGILSTPNLVLIEPTKITHKQVRQNSIDLDVAEQLARIVLELCQRNKAIFVEIPVGSQSARAMCSYGMCCGILGFVKSQGIQLIEVTAGEVKKALTGNKNATKAQMIEAAVKEYPDANFPRHHGKITAKAEHVADAIGSIYAGVRTPAFTNLIRLLEGI